MARKKVKIYDYNFAVAKPYGRLQTFNTEYGSYIEGEVITPYGIVWAYSQGSKKFSHSTTLEFVFKKRSYRRNFDRRYSQKYIVTLANKFAKEIMEKENAKST